MSQTVKILKLEDLGSSLTVEGDGNLNKLEIQVSKEGDNLIIRKEDGLYLADLNLGGGSLDRK